MDSLIVNYQPQNNSIINENKDNNQVTNENIEEISPQINENNSIVNNTQDESKKSENASFVNDKTQDITQSTPSNNQNIINGGSINNESQ